MDNVGRSVAVLLKTAALVSATLVSMWCLFMFTYTHPELPSPFNAQSGALVILGLIQTLLALAIFMAAGAYIVERRIGGSAWLLVPACTTIGCFSLLLFVPVTSSGS